LIRPTYTTSKQYIQVRYVYMYTTACAHASPLTTTRWPSAVNTQRGLAPVNTCGGDSATYFSKSNVCIPPMQAFHVGCASTCRYQPRSTVLDPVHPVARSPNPSGAWTRRDRHVPPVACSALNAAFIASISPFALNRWCDAGAAGIGNIVNLMCTICWVTV
jgi:hypothetical protein